MNKATKWILFGAAAGATAAGVYYVLKNKEKFCVEETCEDGTKKRTYVPIDMGAAKAKVTDAYNKTVEKAQEAWKKVEEKFDNKEDAEEVTEDAPLAEDSTVTINNAGDQVADTIVDTSDAISEDISDFSAEEDV